MHRLPAVLSVMTAGVALAALPRTVHAQVQPQSVESSRTLKLAGAERSGARSSARSYLLYRPTGAVPRSGMPLLLVFHGGGGTARGIAQHTKLTEVAGREGFALVYPQGIGRRWNDGRGIHSAYDDVGFIRALLDTLRRELPIDSRRIYAAGISNGAVFVHRLACELPGTFAAIAAVAGAFPARMESRCAGAQPVAVIAFQGTADPLMPYRGKGLATQRGAVLSAERSVALWARVNGCAGTPVDSLLPEHRASDGTRVRRFGYVSCRSGRPVLLYRIEGGGHTWPGGPAAGASVGRVSREVDATTAIVQFFDRNR